MPRRKEAASSRRQPWASRRTVFQSGSLVLLIIYGANLLRLHHRLPSPSRVPDTGLSPRRRRAEQSDEETNTLLLQLEDRLRRRDAVCHERRVNHTKLGASFYNPHLRARTASPLLDNLRKFRTSQSRNQLPTSPRCYLPSPCSLTTDTNETRIAAVLVLHQQHHDTDLDYRRLLIATFQLLLQTVVHEVWILLPEVQWSAENIHHGNDLFRERFVQWHRQGPPYRVGTIAVKDGSWLKAVQQLDSESAADAILWVDLEYHWNLDAATTATGPSKLWKTFVEHRIAQWRSAPTRMHVSHQLLLDQNTREGEDKSASTDVPDCLEPWRVMNSVSTVEVTPVASQKPNMDALLLPYLHGVVHDRSWLCFWQHPALDRFSTSTDWQVVSLATTLWMAHLAGISFVVPPGRTEKRVELNFSPTAAADVVDFFGVPSRQGFDLATQCGSP
jgi:hypothetical protein